MSEVVSVGAKITDGPECQVNFTMDNTTEEAITRYGEDVVFSRYKASLVIDLQSFLRGQMKTDPPKTADEIQGAVDEWAPGVKAKGRSPAERARDIFGKLSEDDRKALLEEFGAL